MAGDAGSWSVTINENAIAGLPHSDDMRAVMTQIGFAVETEAKRLVSVKTGNLRRSITSTTLLTHEGWVAQIGTNVRYGIYQELGTRYHPAHPYLRPALGAVSSLTGG